MSKKTNKIVLYGKGGIGKSTIASNLSMIYARQGLKVLQVGCDPKHDSTSSLLKNRKEMKTVMDIVINKRRSEIVKDDFIIRGKKGIDCIECGGPQAGVGCAGRGISLMFEILNDLDIIDKYDMVIFDVLGDVVCGGFAAPLKLNFADRVFIVVSEEFASLYAANNIARAIIHYEYNGIYLGGLIINLRDNQADLKNVHIFAQRLNTTVLAVIPRSKKISEADYKNQTMIEAYPDSDLSRKFLDLANRILRCKKNNLNKLKPIEENNLYEVFLK
ncbi:MAG: AAA family ATPase [Spirochaetes bacterium]|nr:AAA family ATPase [Spirochaetota bacterium]